MRGSDNVYADLGLPNAKQRRLKASLMRSINEEIASRRWCARCAAAQLELSEDDVQNIAKGRGSAFSVRHLQAVVHRLRQYRKP